VSQADDHRSADAGTDPAGKCVLPARKTAVVRQLSDYWIQTRSLAGIAVLPLDEHRFQRAQSLREQFGLMTNDSLLVAAAEVFGIDSLATNDSDFDAVPWLNVYKPTHLP
jgi:predicted nucleic acid-binding protein